VRFQIHLYCYLKSVPITSQGLDCLTLLAMGGEAELSDFCEDVASRKIFRNSQSVRTALAVVEKKDLVRTFKPARGRKRVLINEEILVQTKGNILLDLKVFRIDTKESPGTDRKDQ